MASSTLGAMREYPHAPPNGHLPISPTDQTPNIKTALQPPTKPSPQPTTPSPCRQPLQPMRMQRVMGRVIKPEVRKHNIDSSFGPLQRLSSSQNSPPPDGRSKFGLYEPSQNNGQSSLCKLNSSGQFKPPGQPSE